MDRLTEVASERFAQWSLLVTIPNKFVARLFSLGAIALFVFSCVLFTNLPSSLFPLNDGTKLSINVELSPSATIERSQDVAIKLENYSKTTVTLMAHRSLRVLLNSLAKPAT